MAQLNDRFRHARGRAMDAHAWAGWMAVKVAAETFFRALSGDAAAVRAQLARADARFDGHKGMPLSFRPWDRQLRQPLYVRRHAEVVRVPARGATGPAAAQLDAMGATAAASTCRAGT